MADDNIVSLSSRLSRSKEAEILDTAQAGASKELLDHLDQIRSRVEAGKTTGLVWIELTDDANESGFGMKLGPKNGYIPVLGMLSVAKAFALNELLADADPDE